MGKEENGRDMIESAPREQTYNDSFTSVDGGHQNNRSGNLVTVNFL